MFFICGTQNRKYESLEQAAKELGFVILADTDIFWNDDNINMVKLGDDWYCLNQWNGEVYYNCWKYKDSKGTEPLGTENYTLCPAYIGEGEPDEDGEYASYEVVGYRFE